MPLSRDVDDAGASLADGPDREGTASRVKSGVAIGLLIANGVSAVLGQVLRFDGFGYFRPDMLSLVFGVGLLIRPAAFVRVTKLYLTLGILVFGSLMVFCLVEPTVYRPIIASRGSWGAVIEACVLLIASVVAAIWGRRIVGRMG